ncbi:hypothetical protein [Nocardioides daejeonensis]|uniref:hypothetical protein n=1 Tax=Nocardioides daejeonensis TaxID=1046556 RepID=UPI000D7436AB|nr:hypothetical protein [Nocardioides daejeonensis]
MPVFHDVLIGVISIAVLVLIVGEATQFKAALGGKGQMTPMIFGAAIVEVLSAVGLLVMVLVYADSINTLKVTIQMALMVVVLVLAVAYRTRKPLPAWVLSGIGGASLVCYVYSSI